MAQEKKYSAIKVIISRDKLTASICLSGKNDFVYIEEIHQELEKAGVKYGIKEDAVLMFSVNPSREPVVVARGADPTPGRDGYMEVLFDKNYRQNLGSDSDVIDYRETSTLISVEAGTQLVEVYPPVPGKEGTAVTGEAIGPPKPKEINLLAGKGVFLSEEGDKAYAQVNGRPWIKEAGLTRIISCDPMYIHNGDVDIKKGNLRFKGDVKIAGNVFEAMEVQATGNVEVQGLVIMARVVSGGKIIIFGNVVGSRLRAGILFPGAKKLGFMMADLHAELESLAQALEQLKIRKIVNFDLVDFGRVVLGLLDSRYKNIRPMVKSTQAFVKNKTEELPQEVVDAVNSLSCFSGLFPLNEIVFKNVLREVTNANELLIHSRGQESASIFIKSADSSVIQSSGNVTVSGQGCVNTNITAGGDVTVKGSFKGGEILCEGNVEINELGSNLGAPPTVRVAAGSAITVKKAYEGSVIQVGNRRLTITKKMEFFRARLNKEEQLELY